MARQQTIGFESGDALVEGIALHTSGGALTFDASVKRSGTRSFKSDSTASGFNGYCSLTTLNGRAENFDRAYVYVTAYPDSTVKIMQRQCAGTLALSIRMTSTGTLQLWNDSGTPAQIGSDSTAIALTTWARVEMHLLIGTGATDAAEGRLNGVSFASGASLSINDSNSAELSVGWIDAPGASKIIYVDDVATNDTTGTNQTSWCGDGKVVMLVPTADSARATLWTAGAGGTTSLFSAVSNRPPVGVAAASETNTSQIKHAGGASGTTDAYDATMTTYTAAGVGGGDQVVLIQGVLGHGEAVVSGTKLLNFSGVSNPVIAATSNFAAGNDQASAEGTWPSFWYVTLGAVQYAPAVTSGTAPVMRVTRPETATGEADVAFMGMFVEYAPLAPLPEDPLMFVPQLPHLRM